jgi:Protein of unknown function (DUF3489)
LRSESRVSFLAEIHRGIPLKLEQNPMIDESKSYLAPGIRSVAMAPARKAAVPTKDAAPAKPPKDAGENAKFGSVAALLRRPGGASMTEILAATSWQWTTARGRISDGVSKLLQEGEAIWSRKVGRERHYTIMKS